MPFGKVESPEGGGAIDFDRTFEQVLRPAIEAAGLQPYRDDYVGRGGLVQKAIYEALLLCEYAVADLTTANGNVLYELGVRHAVRPASTLTVSARPDTIPFDVSTLRTIRYHLDDRHEVSGVHADLFGSQVTRELLELQRDIRGHVGYIDSPLFQLIEGWQPPLPSSLKTDVFAARVSYDEGLKDRLDALGQVGMRGKSHRDVARLELDQIVTELGDFDEVEPGILVHLLTTYRALEAWDGMIRLVDASPNHLRARVLIQEQLALALNRRAEEMADISDRDRAIRVLESLIEEGRASSETFGILGRIHKSRWRNASIESRRLGSLDDAIDAYAAGFELNPLDPYPGINALTLRRVRGDGEDEEHIARLVPVVQYAAERLLKRTHPTYWMHATLVETAVLRDDAAEALHHLRRARRLVTEAWWVKTTVEDLKCLAERQESLNRDPDWVTQMSLELESLTVSVDNGSDRPDV